MPRDRRPSLPSRPLLPALLLGGALLLLLLLGAAPATARGQQQGPNRPRLAASADTNDWEAYFDFGVKELRRRRDLADAAFYWASKLNPERAEPLFARWVAFWLRDFKRWKDYLNGQDEARLAPDVLAADSLPVAAMMRNPFVHQGLAIILYDELPGRWREDNLTAGYIAYAQPNFPRAIEYLGRALRNDQKSRAWIRTTRAQCFVVLQQYDSAAAELAALKAELTARERGTIGAGYQSKEMLAYAAALVHLARGDRASARRSLQEALSENVAFYPAHDLLGQLALSERDTAAALRAHEQASLLAPNDPVMQYHYGTALIAASRADDATVPLRQAIATSPWYAAPRFALATALETLGERGEARATFEDYLALAARSDSASIGIARARIAALAARERAP